MSEDFFLSEIQSSKESSEKSLREITVRSVGPGFYLLPAGLIGLIVGIIGLIWFVIDIFMIGDILDLTTLPATDVFAEILPYYDFSWIGGLCVTIFFFAFVLFFLMVATDLHGVEVFLIIALGAIAILILVVVGLVSPELANTALAFLVPLILLLLGFLGAPHSLVFVLVLSVVIIFGVIAGYIQNWFKPYEFKPNAVTFHDYTGKKRALSNLQNFEVHVGRADFLERVLFRSGTITLVIQERDDIQIRNVLRVTKRVEQIDALLRKTER